MNKITKEQVIKDIEEYKENKERFVLRDVVLDFVLEALKNQKIGHWIDNKVQTKLCNCSECNTLSKVYFKYCPHCGAKMEGE